MIVEKVLEVVYHISHKTELGMSKKSIPADIRE